MRRLVWGQGEGCGGAGEREHRSWLGRPPRSPGCPRRSRHAASSLPWRLAVAAAFDSEHADRRGVKKVLRESWLKCDALLSFLERHERVESRKREEQNRQHSAHRSLPVWSSGKREIVGHHVSRVTRHPSEAGPTGAGRGAPKEALHRSHVGGSPMLDGLQSALGDPESVVAGWNVCARPRLSRSLQSRGSSAPSSAS